MAECKHENLWCDHDSGTWFCSNNDCHVTWDEYYVENAIRTLPSLRAEVAALREKYDAAAGTVESLMGENSNVWADYDAAKNEIEALKAAQRWIPGERLPERAGIYMVIDEDTESDDWINGYEHWLYDLQNGWEYKNRVLYWRPIPAPPEVQP